MVTSSKSLHCTVKDFFAIPLDYVRECFLYYPSKGQLYWSSFRPRSHFDSDWRHMRFLDYRAGKEAGYYDAHYILVDLTHGNKHFRVRSHYIVWRLFGGVYEDDLVLDHINGDDKDNAIDNLRMVTQGQNMINVGIRSSNKTGVIGVCRDNKRDSWVGSAVIDGKYVRKRFPDFDAAVAWRRSTEISVYGDLVRDHKPQP